MIMKHRCSLSLLLFIDLSSIIIDFSRQEIRLVLSVAVVNQISSCTLLLSAPLSLLSIYPSPFFLSLFVDYILWSYMSTHRRTHGAFGDIPCKDTVKWLVRCQIGQVSGQVDFSDGSVDQHHTSSDQFDSEKSERYEQSAMTWMRTGSLQMWHLVNRIH